MVGDMKNLVIILILTFKNPGDTFFFFKLLYLRNKTVLTPVSITLYMLSSKDHTINKVIYTHTNKLDCIYWIFNIPVFIDIYNN